MTEQLWEEVIQLAVTAVGVVGVVVIAVVIAVREVHIGRGRMAQLRRWVDDNGWSYQVADDSLVEWFVGVPFDEGMHEHATHVLRGRWRGRDVVMYGYGFTKGRTTYEYHVVAVQMPARRPWLQLTPESSARRLLDKVGVRDLQLEDEEFNTTFHIQTGSERFTYDVLHPRMMAWLLADPARRCVPFRFEQWHLLI